MGKIKHIKKEVDGILFDSTMEADYYEHLKELQKRGIVKSFTLQPRFLLQEKFVNLNGMIIYESDPDFAKIRRKNKLSTVLQIEYISDFDVFYKDGREVIIDVKGQITPEFALKKKMFMLKYPQHTLELWTYDRVTKDWYQYDEYRKLVRERSKLKKEAAKECQKKTTSKNLAKEKKSGRK